MIWRFYSKNQFANGWLGARRTHVLNFRVYVQRTVYAFDAYQTWGDVRESACSININSTWWAEVILWEKIEPKSDTPTVGVLWVVFGFAFDLLLSRPLGLMTSIRVVLSIPKLTCPALNHGNHAESSYRCQGYRRQRQSFKTFTGWLDCVVVDQKRKCLCAVWLFQYGALLDSPPKYVFLQTDVNSHILRSTATWRICDSEPTIPQGIITRDTTRFCWYACTSAQYKAPNLSPWLTW